MAIYLNNPQQFSWAIQTTSDLEMYKELQRDENF